MLLFLSSANAYSLKVVTEVEWKASFEQNTSAEVSFDRFEEDCGKKREVTIFADKHYEKMFLQGTAISHHWNTVCGFVRGHCGYNAIEARNSTSTLFFSQSNTCNYLDDYVVDFSFLLAENSFENQTVFFRSFESFPKRENWGLKTGLENLQATLTTQKNTVLTGTEEFENGKRKTKLWFKAAENSLLKTLVPIQSVAFTSNGLPQDHEVKNKVFTANIGKSKKYQLYFEEESFFSAHVFFKQKTLENQSENWVLNVKGNVDGLCVLSGFPKNAYNFKVNLEETNSTFEKRVLSWNCTLSKKDYFVEFKTPFVFPKQREVFGALIKSVERVQEGQAPAPEKPNTDENKAKNKKEKEESKKDKTQKETTRKENAPEEEKGSWKETNDGKEGVLRKEKSESAKTSKSSLFKQNYEQHESENRTTEELEEREFDEKDFWKFLLNWSGNSSVIFQDEKGNLTKFSTAKMEDFSNSNSSGFFKGKGKWIVKSSGGALATVFEDQNGQMRLTLTKSTPRENFLAGLSIAKAASENRYLLAVAAIALVTLAVFRKKTQVPIQAKKEFNGKKVLIKICNKTDKKTSILVEDVAPENSKARNINPKPSEKKETVLGTIIRWQITLEKKQCKTLQYLCNSTGKKQVKIKR
ncbi:MAG: hypothetical protein ACE5DI_00810 [Candidatus Micrarchaeia archaeon]